MYQAAPAANYFSFSINSDLFLTKCDVSPCPPGTRRPSFYPLSMRDQFCHYFTQHTTVVTGHS